MKNIINKRLSSETKVIYCLYNNKKGHNIKYQQFEKSNEYINVRGSIFMKYNHYHKAYFSILNKAILRYADQAILLLFLMQHYDTLFYDSCLIESKLLI